MGQEKQTLFHEISDFIEDGSQSEHRDHTNDHREHRDQVKRSRIDNATLLWTSGSSPVEAGNWAEGYPVPGINKDSECSIVIVPLPGISEIAPPYIAANITHKFIWSPNHPNLYPNNHVQVRPLYPLLEMLYS